MGSAASARPEVDALLQAVGQPPDRSLAHVLDLEEVDDLLDALAVAHLLAQRGPDAQRLQQDVGADHQVAAGEQVVQHGHALEEREALERARDPLARGQVRLHRLRASRRR